LSDSDSDQNIQVSNAKINGVADTDLSTLVLTNNGSGCDNVVTNVEFNITLHTEEVDDVIVNVIESVALILNTTSTSSTSLNH